MRRVYLWMSAGLIVTAMIALVAQTLPDSLISILMIPAIILELIVVIGLSALVHRISPTLALLAFLFYSALNGITLTPIFWAYQQTSIAFSFFATASMFAAMTIVGYTTRTDLTKFGSLLMMGLVGMIIASVINIFFANKEIYWLLSFIGVIIFVGLTAYDTQRIKMMTMQAVSEGNTDVESRVGVIGALRLYLDFINLFLLILRFAGGRRK
ncbi:MAG: Bax inhibitor-1/YccA family protein [Chloroflexi bacterium]|nr:Bax inhibitor-1/YccA family protein [Chloroflexota bacterium]